MNGDHRALREALGVYALGALEPEEALAVERHLEGCAACRELLAELAPLARALPAVEVAPERLAPDPAVLLARVARERRSSRRRSRVAALGGAALVAAASVATVSLVSADPSGDRRPAPQGRERALVAVQPGARGTIRTLDRFWGTQLTLEVRGLPARRRAVVWLQRRDGSRVPAGTVNGLGAGLLRAQLAVAVRVPDATAVGVSDASGRTLLSAPVAG